MEKGQRRRSKKARSKGYAAAVLVTISCEERRSKSGVLNFAEKIGDEAYITRIRDDR